MAEFIKVFVSVPMNGRIDNEIKRAIMDAEVYAGKKLADISRAAGQGFEFVCNINYDMNADLKNPRVDALGEAIKLLADCNYAVFTPGWDAANGCCIEHAVCKMYGIDILDMNEV